MAWKRSLFEKISKIHEKSNFKQFLPYFASRWPPENLYFQNFYLFGIFTYWHQLCQVLRWLGVCSISDRVWKMSMFQIPLRNPYKLCFLSFQALMKTVQKLVLLHFEGWEHPNPQNRHIWPPEKTSRILLWEGCTWPLLGS